MKNMLIASLCMLLLASLCNAQQLITLDQAEASVRTFEGNSSLSFNSKFDDDADGNGEWSYLPCYSLTSTDTIYQTWDVDAFTGEVVDAYYADRYPAASSTPFGQYSQDQCLQIALAFANAKYSNFSNMNFQLQEIKWIRTGWSFFWRQKTVYDAVTPNHVEIEVNPETGCIQRYYCCRYVIPIPQQPQISSQQAIDIAKQITGITTLTAACYPELFSTPDGIHWEIIIEGTDSQGQKLANKVRLDAVTGAVIWNIPSFGQTVSKHLVSVRMLFSKYKNVKVHWLGKAGAVIMVGKHNIKVRPGIATADCNGEEVDLSQKPLIHHSRLLVPAELSEVVSYLVFNGIAGISK
jgi:hypothetical protein